MRKRSGFLLIELLVALAILAILAPALIGMLVVGTETLSRARMHTVAVNLARETMEYVRADGYCNAVTESVVEVEGFPGYGREVEVSLVEIGEGIRVKEVRVTVNWNVSGQAQDVALVTYQAWR